MKKKIYMDNAATTPIKKEVLEEMMPYLTENYGNPSSVYSLGSISKRAVEDARMKISKAIGASNKFISRLILTQASIFAIVGFVIAYFLLLGFQKGVASSGLIFSFSPLLLLGIFAVIGLISIGGASFALRRIKGIEPASVFR